MKVGKVGKLIRNDGELGRGTEVWIGEVGKRECDLGKRGAGEVEEEEVEEGSAKGEVRGGSNDLINE